MMKTPHQEGVSLQSVGSFERGQTVPRPETLAAIMGALEVVGIEVTVSGSQHRSTLRRLNRSSPASLPPVCDTYGAAR